MPPINQGDGEHAGTEHLGRGWAFPVRWSGDGEVAQVAGEDDVREALRIILKTAPGERVMHPEFGAGVERYVFGTASRETAFRLKHDVERALIRWEPRAIIQNVVADASREPGRIDVVIEYATDPHRREQSLVYPFYLSDSESE